MVKCVFSMTLKALQGFIDSAFQLAQVPLTWPHYSCISRRAKDVEVLFKTKTRGTIPHLAIDAITHEIIVAELTLSNISDGEVLPNLLKQARRTILEISIDCAYNTRQYYEAIRIKKAIPLISARRRATFWEKGCPRNLPVGFQAFYGSNKQWINSLDTTRSISEMAMHRVKKLLGGRLSLINYNVQAGEAYAMIKALNKVCLKLIELINITTLRCCYIKIRITQQSRVNRH